MYAIFPDSVALPPVPLSPGIQAGNFVFVSGQVATDARGNVYRGDFAREVEMTIDNVEAILAAAGGTLNDVVKVGAWLSEPELFEQFNALYAARLGSHRPARTTVVVRFGHPEVRVEVDAIAYLPERNQP
ncbi:RidA family protein [Arthrobacter sp. KBS0702]|uniref:RidA family protein n=1 Tax=Arthrobacter sp. KBS0702 TaxID=2578107 RepID=UPI00110DA439|nr:RidA family protein [Arthrobacter sp. KBS0702]QDW30627.1 RidA family protein [Arthrobacter sp. KBS0702]